MKTKRNIILLATFVSALFTLSCSLRELEDDPAALTIVSVGIDWSESGIDVRDMHRASIWLFPHNGAPALEYRLENDLSGRDIIVPPGVYSVLVFNETVDENDWSGVAFTGTERYETFAAVSPPLLSQGFYKRSTELPLVDEPEALAVWSFDKLEVKPAGEIANEHYPQYKSTGGRIDLSDVKPTPRFERVSLTAYVTNLASSMQATGTIDGMASGVYLATGELMNEPAAHAFILNGRVYEDNGKSGTTTRTFNVFGRQPGASNRLVAIDFLLVDGTFHPRQEFDVKNQSESKTIDNVLTHIINLGYAQPYITLPDLDVEKGVAVDRWDEVIIPLK